MSRYLFLLFGAACIVTAAPPDQAAGRHLRVLVVPLSAERTACPAVSTADAVRFEVDGNRAGVAEWLADASEYAFLAIDDNRNGVIDNATELVSNRMTAGATAAFNVLVDRAEAVGPPAGAIGAGHPLHADLLLWADANRNGRSELSELRPVSEFLAQIGLGALLLGDGKPAADACRLRGWSVTIADWRGQPRPDDRYHPFWDVVLRTTP